MPPEATAARSIERLRFDDLSRHLLLKNGNYLYKVPFRGGFAVLKVYQGSRTWLEYATKTVGNVVVCNQTSFMPRARRRTELGVIRLWREAGFRVFGVHEDAIVEGIDPTLQALFEYVPARKLVDLLGDPALPLERRLELWRGYLPVWHRRHRLAVERAEPRFVHENGDLKHVMPLFASAAGEGTTAASESGPTRSGASGPAGDAAGDPVRDYLQFDFEMVFRSPHRVKEFVAREILQYLKSLGKTVRERDFDVFMAETVRHYPGRDLLEHTHAFAFANPNPILRLARARPPPEGALAEEVLQVQRRAPPEARVVEERALERRAVEEHARDAGAVTEPRIGKPRAHRPPERIRVFGLDAEVLARSPRGDDRHMVLKIERAGRPLVLKLYGRKRDPIRDFLRDVGHRAIVGKTGMTPQARMKTERATLELWAREGFDVPRLADDVELPPEVPSLRLLFEFVPGESAQLVFASGLVPLEAKVPRMEALAREWGRRHARALELDEPGLIQAHATIAHVLFSPKPDGEERLVTFDFEVAWGARHSVKRLVSLELAQNLDSLARRASPWHLEALIAALVRAYPDRSRLERLPRDVRRGRLPVFSALTRLGLWLRERGPGRKLEALELLERELSRPAPIARYS